MLLTLERRGLDVFILHMKERKKNKIVSCDLSDLYLCLIQIYMIYVTEVVGLINILYDCFQAYYRASCF